MQLSKSSYLEILSMPVDRMKKYLKWKNKFDEKVSAMQEDMLND